MIQFPCSRCGRIFTVPEDAAGKKGKCSRCGAVQEVPDRQPAAVGVGGNGAAGGIPVAGPDADLPAAAALLPADREDADAILSALDAPPAPVAPLDRDALTAACVAAVKACEPVGVRPVAYPPPPEPWYYQAVTFIGWVTCFLGILAVAVGLFLLAAASNEVSQGGHAVNPMPALAVMALSLPLFLTAAVQLLGVDVARNIRTLRYHQH